MAKDSSKTVMDIAKPGSAKPEIGSKPMIVGHQSIMADPTLRSDDEKNSPDEGEKTKTPAKKIVLTPVSEASDPERKESDVEEESSAEDMEPDNGEQAAADQSPEPAEEPEEKPADAEEEATKEEQDKHAKEERLQELIKSKKYFVPIKEGSSSSVGTFLLSFIVVCLVGLIVLAVLVDAGILDLGVELPFDLIKNN